MAPCNGCTTDAAEACVHVALHQGPLPGALNVVAPDVASREQLLRAALAEEELPAIHPGGSSVSCRPTFFRFGLPIPGTKPRKVGQATSGREYPRPVEDAGCSVGPGIVQGRPCERQSCDGARLQGFPVGQLEGWRNVGPRRDGRSRHGFSHNGHVPPFLDTCLDEEA